jgi:pyridoxal phosphate enzyme (YggS family)
LPRTEDDPVTLRGARHWDSPDPPCRRTLVFGAGLPETSSVALSDNLLAVQRRIQAACLRADRDPASVTLVAVTKGQPPEVVDEAARLGLGLVGENKVQEARAKIPLCSSRLRWHMVGHLQTNKCRDAVQLFEMIHSVDSLHLAVEINKWADRAARTMPVLLEVNLAGESSKFGYAPERLLAEVKQIRALPRLEVRGLMTMAPWTSEPEKARPVFRELRKLRQGCEEALGAELPCLSMGMTGDFEVAIEEGATLVRIGTALFGERPRGRPVSTDGP